ncbi:MAG: hypothetical protein R2873_11805 [Caldilineaceae bacterium]
MRNESEVNEHLEWLKAHCQRYAHEQRDVAIAQLMTLLWVLGHEPTAAKEKAEAFWDESRAQGRYSH